MKLFNIHVITCSSAGDFHSKFKKRLIFHTILETVKLFFIAAIAVFILLEYGAPLVQKSLQTDSPAGMEEFLSLTKSSDSSVKEVLRLVSMIRFITENQLSEAKMLRYASLISHASKRHGENPLEIIAIIMAESNFKENSVNKETGDYGLGQINWEHWGKDFGLMPHQLLDPSINIFLTCHVYKFFGKDFGKYHRGGGIQSNAYLVNVRSILSTLNALLEGNKENVS
ncbi:MAG TPA: transglycosylase SLT domain-containing protein [Thermodesulfobacteriota bacterium]|nr:transglycosylase SLT domain-containing protein [Thermodesulfobacteriota bacterium]